LCAVAPVLPVVIRQPDNLRRAIHWFEKAIETDPNFARARAMWVCSASGLPNYDWEDGRNRTQAALELDPNDPEANRIMGSILLHEKKFEASRPYHIKAVELAPNDAYIVGRCACFHIFSGEPETALDLLDRAEQLDPYLPGWITEDRIAAYYAMDRYEDALIAARALTYQSRRSRMYRAASRVALGDLDAAREVISEALGISPDLTTGHVEYSDTYRDDSISETLKDRLRQAGLPDGPSPYNVTT
ncbi:MAG: tetratricopeptide repeat protein, partial [Pseudomonadota bacterium]